MQGLLDPRLPPVDIDARRLRLGAALALGLPALLVEGQGEAP
ncbi:hypothetical protein WMF18_31805 [Sorangium sp. So ce315]